MKYNHIPYIKRDIDRLKESEYSLKWSLNEYLSDRLKVGEKLNISHAPILWVGKPEYITKNEIGTVLLKCECREKQTFDFLNTEDILLLAEYIVEHV